MNRIDRHLTDEELLQAADGELAPRPDAAVRQHLMACWECRKRMKDVEESIREFVQLHHAELDGQIPAADGPRRLLMARLAKVQTDASRESTVSLLNVRSSGRRMAWVLALGAAASLVLGVTWQSRPRGRLSHEAGLVRDSSLPDPRLTPGRFRTLGVDEVCAARSYEQARVNSPELKQAVLREYGMPNTASADHEIDFLVIPELGGTEELQNLWPEPYASTVWNAHVKDDLEERLHTLVCERKIDLATAQRDISTDWISAYKKYFQTDQPRQYVGVLRGPDGLWRDSH